MATKPAPVKWAQRNDLIYLNFEVQDVEQPEVVVEKDKIIYRATTKDKEKYETVLNLFGEIKPEDSKWMNRDRGTEFVLIKKESGPYWKRLLKDDNKYHWLKVDFNRWKDEDDSDSEAGGGTNFEEMMRHMGGMRGMGGLGGMGGMGGFPDMGDISNINDSDDNEGDKCSDDDDIPGLEDGKSSEQKEEGGGDEP